MNGHSDEGVLAYGPQDEFEYAAGQDDGGGETEPDCPFCGLELGYDREYFCDNCEVNWPNIQAVEADRIDWFDILQHGVTQ